MHTGSGPLNVSSSRPLRANSCHSGARWQWLKSTLSARSCSARYGRRTQESCRRRKATDAPKPDLHRRAQPRRQARRDIAVETRRAGVTARRGRATRRNTLPPFHESALGGSPIRSRAHIRPRADSKRPAAFRAPNRCRSPEHRRLRRRADGSRSFALRAPLRAGSTPCRRRRKSRSDRIPVPWTPVRTERSSSQVIWDVTMQSQLGSPRFD